MLLYPDSIKLAVGIQALVFLGLYQSDLIPPSPTNAAPTHPSTTSQHHHHLQSRKGKSWQIRGPGMVGLFANQQW